MTVRWLDDDEQATWRAFLAATRLLMDRLDRELQAGAGLPHSYYEILVRLSEVGPIANKITAVATLTAAREATITPRISAQITRMDLLTNRTVHAGDVLAVLEAAAPVHVEGVRRHVFDQLTPDQIRALGEISRTLHDHLEAATPAG